jgi:hypothetical protein
MNDVLPYLISFLLGDDVSGYNHAVGYTADTKLFRKYDLVIIPSGFFNDGVYGTPASLPSLPLKVMDEGLPFLFGEAKEERTGNTFILHADLIASAYFLLTRYEEMVRRDVRDVHGRFPGQESLPFRAGFIQQPVVDGYRSLLRRRLGLPEVRSGLRNIFLTHDLDAPFLYRSWKGLVRSLIDKRSLSHSLRGKFGEAEEDPYYTFPLIFEQDGRITGQDRRAQSIFFLRAGGRTKEDKPHYSLQSRDMRSLIDSILEQGCGIGLHASYEAGLKPSLIMKEKERLERSAGITVTCNRHHFLASREPEDMDCLEVAGISDDFTLGYADVAGFRMGTSHPFRRINPQTRCLTSLRLHPLAIMDSTLEEPKYMGLSHEEASTYCLRLISEAEKAGGELSLLWHNTSMRKDTPGSYLNALYISLITHLRNK